MSNITLNEILPKDYEPSESEPYMSPKQLAYFRNILLRQKDEILQAAANALENLSGLNQPDLNDQAALEAEATIELRQEDRKRKLLHKIDEALIKIETGEYGYCEDTGDAIGLARLMARPTATRSVMAQKVYEDKKKQFADNHEDESTRPEES